ncbi:MAG: Gfo/Idh/MocA family oxidoreductase, partial [Planctomycetes bacterium]|nr:Gfo/Idh/MocA family oxidoreductase [Planctomycetota bacterium]
MRQKFLEKGIPDLASGNGLGSMYYGYSTIEEPVKIGLIGTGDEAGVLIGAINPTYVQVVAIADIRPYSIYRAFYGDAKNMKARPGLLNKYGLQAKYEDVQKLVDKKAKEITLVDKKKNPVTIRCYSDLYDELLDDPEVEAVIIALPLHLHRDAAIKALKKGKHVLSEKLMAHSV